MRQDDERRLQYPKQSRWRTFRMSPIPRVIAGGLIVAGVGLAIVSRPGDQPAQLPDTTSASDSAIPGVSAEQEQVTPPDLVLFMQVFANWRNSLPERSSVNTTFYPEGVQATVVSETGIVTRMLPTETSTRVTAYAKNDRIGLSAYDQSRFKIAIIFPDGHTEEWLGYRELTPEFKSDDPRRYKNMYFSIKLLENEETIRIDQEPENAITINWPKYE